MPDVPPAVAEALRESAPRVSEAVRSFLRQAPARGLAPSDFGYILYRRERQAEGLPPEVIRVNTVGDVHFDGEATGLEHEFRDGLPFYLLDGKLQRGAFPPRLPWHGDDVAPAAVTTAANALINLLGWYLDTGESASSLEAPPPPRPRTRGIEPQPSGSGLLRGWLRRRP